MISMLDKLQARHFFWISTAAAIATILLKTLAWWVTGSVGLLSDAMESFVNLAGAVFALWMITIAQYRPDAEHPLGHAKADYFSAGFEGILIFGAAGAIIWFAVLGLLEPQPLEALGFGLALSVGSSVINLLVALALRRASRRLRSIALEGSPPAFDDSLRARRRCLCRLGVEHGEEARYQRGSRSRYRL